VNDDPQPTATTELTVDIQVPLLQSNALQVTVELGNETVNASYVEDVSWLASAEVATNQEIPLTVTYYEGNGTIVLGTFENLISIGSETSQTVSVTADQFDTARWDDDDDGSPNLFELIVGSYMTDRYQILLFSETKGYRHPSIPVALDTIESLAEFSDMRVDRANDSNGVFTETNLAQYDAVVWVSTSGNVLNDDEQAAFENYIRAGGGYAGIHAASDTEYDWPWYGELVGAYFERHPDIQYAVQAVEDATHPSTSMLPSSWARVDEWYDYNRNPRADVTVLLTLDESSYSGGTMGADHPSAWYHEFDGGRSWYTGGGHTEESYLEADFGIHLIGGLRYAVGSH